MARIFDVKVNGKSFRVEVEELSASAPAAPRVSAPPVAAPPSASPAPTPASAPPAALSATAAGPGAVTAPMASTISRVLAQPGQSVAAGDKMFILEAMKMETPLLAPASGKVLEVLVKAGDRVEVGQVLARLG
ncbi:MAG: biotin/lipoyl-binding protein [Myxococcales bacterium]|nr:biotin/lipoyl-binding protein [Myxococcales bacterium]